MRIDELEILKLARSKLSDDFCKWLNTFTITKLDRAKNKELWNILDEINLKILVLDNRISQVENDNNLIKMLKGWKQKYESNTKKD